jgi:hypothetical protein
MVDQVQVGQPTNLGFGVGSIQNMRGGRQGDLIVSELHGRYYEQCYNKNVFNAASQAVATTTVGLATTYTGLALSNPINSPVNLVLLRATLMQSVIQSTQPEAFALAYGYNQGTNVTHTTPVTPQCNVIGATNVPNAKADASATLPTAPVYGDFLTNTASATVMNSGVFADIAGSVILPPGGFACFVTPAQASVAGMWFGFHWEEVPV